MIKAVIFDLDNTLVDFMSTKKHAIESAAAAMIDAGLNRPKSEIINSITAIYDKEGYEFQTVFDRLLIEMCGEIDFKILANGIVAYRQVKDGFMTPYPHVNSTLISLAKQNFKLGVVTDAPQREAWLRLCYVKLQDIFDVVITYEQTHQKKPHPAPFERALAQLKIKPPEALMIGDWAERDMVGARQIGMKTVFARYGDLFDTQEPGADYEITDISQILDIIERENSKI